MPMHGLLADIVVLLHLLFILFVIFGGLLVLWKGRLAWLHIPLMVWGAIVNLIPADCPLTPLEKKLRLSAGDGGYEESFINHYITPLVYPPGLTADNVLYFSTALLSWNLLLYALIIYRNLEQRKKGKN
jgi:hypothetical protein